MVDREDRGALQALGGSFQEGNPYLGPLGDSSLALSFQAKLQRIRLVKVFIFHHYVYGFDMLCAALLSLSESRLQNILGYC